jgi:heme/copper-type cytochrome/quinol oxidase subunit 2
MFLLYRPLEFFLSLATVLFALAGFLAGRFVVLIYFLDTPEVGRTHLPSLILMTTLTAVGATLLVVGLLGYLIRNQRRLAEENLYLFRRSTQP